MQERCESFRIFAKRAFRVPTWTGTATCQTGMLERGSHGESQHQTLLHSFSSYTCSVCLYLQMPLSLFLIACFRPVASVAMCRFRSDACSLVHRDEVPEAHCKLLSLPRPPRRLSLVHFFLTAHDFACLSDASELQ